MIDLKRYGYIETKPPPDGLLPGRDSRKKKKNGGIKK